MAELKTQAVHFWAYCPWCPPQAHDAGFPLVGKVSFEVNWPGREVAVHTELDTQPLRIHMDQLHPDKVEAHE